MKLFPLLGTLALVALVHACCTPDYGRPLPPGAPALLDLKPGEKRPDFARDWLGRDELLPAVERSLEWMRGPSAGQFFPMEGITYARALASLERFREILSSSPSADSFRRSLDLEFTVYKSAGWNAKGGGVLFTGYCTPILKGSPRPDAQHNWPLYALPPDLVKGPKGEILGRKTASGLEPYPTRRVIEASAMLEGQDLELVWLQDPLDAFIAHVNGSAFVETASGEMLRFGYAGKNGQPYRSLGKELVKDKQLKASEVSLARIRKWGRDNPDELERYLHRNDSYVFFTSIAGNPRGSLNVEVAARRSLATDKAIFPRGGVVFVETRLQRDSPDPRFQQFMLDQDTGGAIRTAGRGDIYLGVGPEAEEIAGRTQAEGQLYYLFLKPELVGKSPAP